MDLTPDGSVQPPGDRLEVEIFFFPGEESLTLEVRAFAILDGAVSDQVSSVAARDDAHRGPDGVWRLTAEVRPRDGHPSIVKSLVVPYASLNLPKGRHQIAYELTALAGKEIAFVRATPMTFIVVTDGVRTEMRQRRAVPEPYETRRKEMAYVVRDGQLVREEVEIVFPEEELRRETVRVQVEIPGEFRRPLMAYSRGPTPNPEEEPKEATVDPLWGRPWSALSEFTPQHQRTVYFITNRQVVRPRERSPERFGDACSSDLTYGTCLVNIPIESHKRGAFEIRTHWWQQRDPEEYFLIESMATMARNLFLQGVGSDDVLLYIHGYNTAFEYAVLRAAQLHHDLQFPGKAMTFSWPSAGTTAGYLHDEDTNAQSVPALVHTFRDLAAAGGETRKIHVIVHSMGNRLLLQAARQFELEQTNQPARKLFGHVALAAPDVDAATFAALVPSVVRQSDSVTLYYCQEDRALLASQTLHMNKPVGLGPFFAAGMETVNADRANTSILGHCYFAEAHPLLLDLNLILLFNRKPSERLPPLVPMPPVFGYSHWALKPLK